MSEINVEESLREATMAKSSNRRTITRTARVRGAQAARAPEAEDIVPAADAELAAEAARDAAQVARLEGENTNNDDAL